MRSLCSVLVSCAVLVSVPANARDWFVKAGSTGDGSQASPFGDPWEALDKCESGDQIHVAAGKYFGRLGKGQWEVPFDDITLLGGYDASFKTRNPWKNLTLLHWDKTSKNRPQQERFTSTKKGTVLDGFVFDQRDQCAYTDPEQTGRRTDPCDGPMRFAQAGTVRNNVIVNPGFDGIVAPVGSTIENNLVVNAVNFGISIAGTYDKTQIATVKNNTVLFTMSFKEPGKGAYSGSAIGLRSGAANITDNILAHSDNHGIYDTGEHERTSVANNVFFMNLYSNLKTSSDGKETAIDDKEMDLIEEVGFKKSSGNSVKNPGFTVDKKWLDAVSKRTAAIPGKLEMDDFNKLRQLSGLPMVAKGGTPPSGVAPAMDLDDALTLMTAKSAGSAGAHIVPLTVSFQGAGAAAVQRDYQRIEPKAWVRKPDPVDGKPLEMIVGVSGTGNTNGVPSQFKRDDYAAAMMRQPDGDYDAFLAFYKKGSSVQRAVEKVWGMWNGSGKPPKVYLVKGVAYALGGYPKGGFLVESFEEYSPEQLVAGNAPAGRDWFVRAGASGGDGSREKPFRDPYQALEKAEAGDFVHVAEGEYFGKLKAGKWKIDTTYISLLGGYDAKFSERNPWKHPTRLRTAPDYKGSRIGYTIEGVDDHTGSVVDGFIFDKVADNKYKSNGDLDPDNSDKSDHLWLFSAGCAIRNNVFLNSAEGGLRTGSGVTVENNIFMNHHRKTVVAQRGRTELPFVFRHNTVLFSWEMRFGEGNGRNGHLLALESQLNAIVDGNIFEFADNDAIRMAATPGDVELTNNTFNHNLFSNVMVTSGNASFIDDKTFGQLRDVGFKKLSGNEVVSAGFPLEQKWFDAYLGRTAYTPGKVTMDDWNQLRELIGQPVIATGGKMAEGFAPAYPWQKALLLFPKNPKVTAGARAKDLPVKFTGVERKVETYEYQDTTWADSAKDARAWEKLDGKRVSLKVVIRMIDDDYQLPEASRDAYTAFQVTGPEGADSGGLPMHVYVKKGGKAERAVRQAKSYSSGTPEQWYFIKGVAKPNKQLIAEVVERADL